MKKHLLLLLLFVFPCFVPGVQSARAQEQERRASFMGLPAKESITKFREWLGETYPGEIEAYRKENKGTYKYRARDFRPVSIRFCVDTTGRVSLMSTEPETLSEAQRAVIESTLRKCPPWTPAEQKGRKVKIAYSVKIR